MYVGQSKDNLQMVLQQQKSEKNLVDQVLSFKIQSPKQKLHATLLTKILYFRQSVLRHFFPRFAGSDVLIQRMSTTTHSLSNQTFSVAT